MTSLKILIIDDEVDYCTILKSYFQQKGYEVFLAFNLKEGLEMVNSAYPDILFLDNNLPDGKGWPHVDSIVEKIPHIRAYLVSAYQQRSDFSSPSPNVTVWEKPLSLNLLNQNF
ncbi:MAG TPA: response regulator [Chitinophagaceae bacterium]|nr:response regulator [Chitinophagaceae bacterium]